MVCRSTLALGAMALVSLASSAAIAQNAPPSYEGDPDVYKVIFEDQNFRVVSGSEERRSRQASLASSSVDRLSPYRLHKRGLWARRKACALANQWQSRYRVCGAHLPAHSAENIGSEDCHQIFVERK